jgi:hypothetical protein
MKNHFFLLVVFAGSSLFSCQSSKVKPETQSNKLVIHFEIDSSGNIKEEYVTNQLDSLAKDLSKKGDRLMLNAYSEQTGDKETNEKIATEMAYAAKEVMLKNSERSYYNVGVTIRGYEEPLNASNPTDIQNRRIEFVRIEQ